MAMKFWNGYQWRRVSEVEARFRRALGQEIVETEAKAPPPPLAPPVKKLDEVLPPVMPGAVVVQVAETTPPLPAAPWPTQPKVVEIEGAPATVTDLTDDELERLTAPES